ncbi:UbiA family prenyltransferase [Jatrophihabitans sp.]|uniref:UbiA family prenyltransferase n=1 Tax=Jatrophihabitans sp. TaxID=1932789 RepID=UPI002C5F2238|nr:UbiA family prenyltransferase [Jatrophihabitans sp.]
MATRPGPVPQLGLGASSPRAAARRLPAVLARCVIEARPVVQLMVLLRFATAALLSAGPVWPGRQLLSGCAAMVTISTCVYLVNGITDLAGDVANGSTRPLARGRLGLDDARTAAWVLGVGGLLLALETGLALTGCALAMAVAGLGYSCGERPWKNRPHTAGISIGVLGASAYLAGCVCTGRLAVPPLLLGAAMTLWMSLVGARTKDFSDVTGDLVAGRLTQAGGPGERALRRRTAASAVAVATAFLVLACWQAHLLVWSATALLLVAGSVAVLVLRGSSADGRARARRPYRAFMLGQYSAHVLVIASVLN